MIRFEARIETRLRFESPDGSRELTVEGCGGNRGQVASDANWGLADQRAYDDLLAKLAAALDEAGL